MMVIMRLKAVCMNDDSTAAVFHTAIVCLFVRHNQMPALVDLCQSLSHDVVLIVCSDVYIHTATVTLSFMFVF
jgi:hypothetical protein